VIVGYNAANINNINLADNATTLNVTTANAIDTANMVFDVTDAVTVIDTGTAIGALTATEIAGYNTANINLMNSNTDGVTINATQFNAYNTETIDFDAGDAITVTSEAGADTLDFNAIGGGIVSLILSATGQAGDTVANFAVGTDVIDTSAIGTLVKSFGAYQYDSTATGNEMADITVNNNVIVITNNNVAPTITQAAAAIALDATVTGTAGYIIIQSGSDAKVYYSTDLGADGTETLLVTLTGISVANLGNGNFDVTV
jgi:hypothetical protein